MRALSRLRSWWRARRDRAGLDRQLREELEFHVDRCAEDLEREGLSPDAARQRARAALGSMPATGEVVRASLGLRLGDEIRGDLRYALRMLRRSPGFTIVAVLSLGLGIGANTAIFSLIDTVLLKPLPVPRPDRLFFVDSSGGRSGQSGPPYPAFEIMRERNRHFSALAAVSGTGFRVTIDGSTERIRGAHASGQFFDVLQLTASHGRLFTPHDDAQIGAGGRDGAVAVISDALWRGRFGANLAVLGKTIEVGTRPVTIVGILPARFHSLLAGYRFDLILPFVLASNDLREPESWWFQAIGRLKDDATVEQAQAELDAFWQAYLNDNRVSAGTRKGFPSIVLTSARRGLSDLRRDYAEPLWIVMAIVARRAGDRLRERRQPAGRARFRAPARDRAAARDRGRVRAPAAPDARRGSAALDAGRGPRPRGGRRRSAACSSACSPARTSASSSSRHSTCGCSASPRRSRC